jgi:hypothetical protein
MSPNVHFGNSSAAPPIPNPYQAGVPPDLGEANSSFPDSLMDLGLTMSGESGMDQQWLTFVRESGILEGSFNAGYQ